MSESKNPVRDRVLVLRVLVPSLEARLREKMEEAEKMAATRLGSNADFLSKEILFDLDGVYCEPTVSDNGSNNTRWNFHCDGALYPARLVNLPCPVELLKTHDHVMYYKSSDVAQLLLVYEDEMAMEEAENMPHYSSDNFPSYYHSGLTPPLKRVVERRFEKRDHSPVPPPRTEIAEIEEELRVMIERISDTAKAKGKNKSQALSTATSKVIQEIEDELVEYEPWMDANGTKPNGIEFDVDDPKVAKNPALWLSANEIREIMLAETEIEERKAKDAAKKEEKKAAKKKKAINSNRNKHIPVQDDEYVNVLGETDDLNVNLGVVDLDALDMSDASFLDGDGDSDELFLGMDCLPSDA
jgi:transcription initiation factor TFIID subunit 7